MLVTSKVLANERPTLPSQCDGLPPEALERFSSLIKRCWDGNPSNRPTATGIVREIESIKSQLSLPDKKEVETSNREIRSEGKFRFPENTDEVQLHIPNLSLHQGSVIETVGDITASCVREGTELDEHLTADISAQASKFDGTNACVFNSIVVAEWIRKNEKLSQLPINWEIFKKAVEEIIISVPELINDARDPSAWYTVEEALDILRFKGIVGSQLRSEQVMMSLSGVITKDGKESLLDGLKTLHRRRPVQAVYTCPPLSFLVSCGVNPDRTANFTLVDTHCVPKEVGANGNAAIVQVNYSSVENAASHLASWIEKRLVASGVGNGRQCMEVLFGHSNEEKGQAVKSKN